ncbi:uncharacterized protein LOC126297917 [Schistocerca gregaria]|uniref:uncharacterized protein LOC126297917 n=1 Tax=Schistocerca gregaria TaxID=7010 RepID=UPI00211E79D2|nr:uncharacterized protein LOC126297917 [Schistocerca gregaria]
MSDDDLQDAFRCGGSVQEERLGASRKRSRDHGSEVVSPLIVIRKRGAVIVLRAHVSAQEARGHFLPPPPAGCCCWHGQTGARTGPTPYNWRTAPPPGVGLPQPYESREPADAQYRLMEAAKDVAPSGIYYSEETALYLTQVAPSPPVPCCHRMRGLLVCLLPGLPQVLLIVTVCGSVLWWKPGEMSEAVTTEAPPSRRRSTRVRREKTQDQDKSSVKDDSGLANKRKASNGVAAATGRQEARASPLAGRVEHSAKAAAGSAVGKTPVQPRTKGRVSDATAVGKAEGKVLVAPAGKAKRRALSAATGTVEGGITVVTCGVQGQVLSATNKANTTPIIKKSKTKPAPKKVSQHSSSESARGRRASFERKSMSRKSRSRKSRKSHKGSSHSASCLTCSEDSYSDESHSDSCSTCSDYDTGSDISCSCSDCEFEDRIKGKRQRAPKKKPEVVMKFHGIYTPD